MPTFHNGRHEFGQNFLTDPATLAGIHDLVARTTGPIIEIGPGDGALTRLLLGLGRPVTVIEIDPALADRLRGTFRGRVHVVNTDFLSHRLPTTPHVIVGNVPFHLTTAILRRILHSPGWSDAILLVQWEVARRRAGVGGATMMTAQWGPWFTFGLEGRVPARAFTPRPAVDGGLLHVQRRPEPLVPWALRRQFQALVHRVYTGPGRGLGQILARTTRLSTTNRSAAWLLGFGLRPSDLPRSLPGDAWVDLFRTTGVPRPQRHGRRHQRGPRDPARKRGR